MSWRSFAWAMKAVMKARVLPAVFGSLPSITTCSAPARSARRSAVQPGGMTTPSDDAVAVEEVRERGAGGWVRDDVEIDGGAQPADEIAAFRGPVVVDHRGGNVIHVQAEGVAEEQDQQERDDEGQGEAAEVADEVEIFLAGDGPDLAQVHGAPCFIKATKASFRSASGRPGSTAETMSAGAPVATIRPALMMTTRPQCRASSM